MSAACISQKCDDVGGRRGRTYDVSLDFWSSVEVDNLSLLSEHLSTSRVSQ